MKRLRVDRTVLAAIVVTVVLVGAYWWVVTLSRDYYIVDAPQGSTFSSAPEGLKVLRTYLREIGVETEVLQTFDELPGDGTIVYAAMATPAREPSEAQRRQLREWVESGGRLVLAGAYANAVIDRQYGVGRAPVRESWPALTPLLPSVYSQGVERLDPGEDRILAANGEWVTHFKDSGGQVLISRTAGEGEIVWLSGVYPISNEGIDKRDNARFATLLVASAGPVYFDEYHHGFVVGGGVWERLGSGGRAAMVLVTAALLAWLWSSTQRIAPAIEPVELKEVRRGTYIASLAGLYRAAGARSDALVSLAEGLRAALARRYGTAEAGYARHPQAAEVIDRVSSAGEEMTEQEFVSIARDIARARQEVEGRHG